MRLSRLVHFLSGIGTCKIGAIFPCAAFSDVLVRCFGGVSAKNRARNLAAPTGQQIGRYARKLGQGWKLADWPANWPTGQHMGPRFPGRSARKLADFRSRGGRAASPDEFRGSGNSGISGPEFRIGGYRIWKFRDFASLGIWNFGRRDSRIPATIRIGECAIPRRRVLRRPRQLFRRRFRPKHSQIRCVWRSNRGRGFGGDLFANRSIPGRRADLRPCTKNRNNPAIRIPGFRRRFIWGTGLHDFAAPRFSASTPVV